jgi:AhpD family alkylhydroperoxidase
MLNDATKELIAVGASVAANCHPCVQFHLKKARELGLDRKTIDQAVAVGQKVRLGAASEMDTLLQSVTGTDSDRKDTSHG